MHGEPAAGARLERAHRVVEAAETDRVDEDAARATTPRAVVTTRSGPHAGSGCSWLIVGGMVPRRIVRHAATACSADEPAPCCPSIDLVEWTGTSGKRSPKVSFSASASRRS